MKRSPMSPRRKPLKRTELKASGGGLTRKPLRQRSKAAVDDSVRQASVRAEVFARDGRCMMSLLVGGIADDSEGNAKMVPACDDGGPVFMHRRKASANGAYVASNGWRGCSTHNLFQEAEPYVMRVLTGSMFVVREGDPEWRELGREANGVR